MGYENEEEQEGEEPDYVNPTVEEIAHRLGPFDYGNPPDDGVVREYKDIILF